VLAVGSADPTVFLKTPFNIYIFMYKSCLSMHSDPHVCTLTPHDFPAGSATAFAYVHVASGGQDRLYILRGLRVKL
jgi:hypothetical protein